MQRPVPTCLLLLAAIALASQCPAQRARRLEDVEVENLRVERRNFTSKAIDGEASYLVYVPRDYDEPANAEKQYPLVLWLHGMFENCMRFHLRGGAAVLDAATGDGTLPPCIFVCAEVGSRSMYVNRPGKRWEDLVHEDLLEHLEATFRLNKERDQRAICGVSMGGMAALRIAFNHPDKFGTVATHSAAVFPDDPASLPPQFQQFARRLGLDEVFGDPIDEGPWRAANPLSIAMRADPDKLSTLRIYFDAGDRDRYQFHLGNQQLHALLDQREVDHTFRLIEGGGHSWGADFQHDTLPHSFSLIGRAFRGESAARRGLESLQRQLPRDEQKPDAKGGSGKRSGV